MTYLLISNLSLALFFLIYRYGLRKLTFFNLNRWYLLGSVLMAYVLPLFLFVELQVPEIMQITLPVLDLTPKAAQVNPAAIETMAQQPSWFSANWIQLGYWLGVLIASGLLLYRVLHLLVDRWSVRNIHGSYSFFNIVKLNVKNEDSKMIQEHEYIHVKQGHSYDIMFMEIIRVFNWFNPILIWIREELKYQHEFIVDEQFSGNKVAYAELLVAYAMNVHPNQLSHEFSNKSLLKERINMIFKDKSNTRNRLFYLSILPLAALILGLVINCKSPNKEKTESEAVIAESPATEASDDSTVIVEEEPKVSNNIEGSPKKFEKARGSLPSASGQQTENEIFDYKKVEIKPTYPGGIDQFRKDVLEAYQFPQAAIDAGIRGTVELSFVIDKEGKIGDIKLIKDLSYGTGQAGVLAIKSAKDWKPGIVNGKPVPVKYTLPIRMDLSQM